MIVMVGRRSVKERGENMTEGKLEGGRRGERKECDGG